MSDFITNTKNKLTYAYAPKKYELGTFASTEITTANTNSTLATHSANTLKAADQIRIAYSASVDNQSGNNEDFTFTLVLGGSSFPRTLTITDGNADTVGITADLTRINATSFFAQVNFIHIEDDGTITSYPVVSIVDDVDVTECTVTAENESVVSAGCDLVGEGGYLVVDTFEIN